MKINGLELTKIQTIQIMHQSTATVMPLSEASHGYVRQVTTSGETYLVDFENDSDMFDRLCAMADGEPIYLGEIRIFKDQPVYKDGVFVHHHLSIAGKVAIVWVEDDDLGEFHALMEISGTRVVGEVWKQCHIELTRRKNVFEPRVFDPRFYKLNVYDTDLRVNPLVFA